MSFRCRQKLNLSPSFEMFSKEEKTLENGECVSTLVSSVKDLPDPELFRLKNQLAAGVNLEEVNSKVLSPKSVDLSRVFTTKKEVNDEK